MKISDNQLADFASPIGKTEEEKCKNALRMVRDALKQIGYADNGKIEETIQADTFAYTLKMSTVNKKEITILVQGSYANKTNIPSQSDVDVAVILESTFIGEYGVFSASDFGFSTSDYDVFNLKDDIFLALQHKFGSQNVKRGDKALKVRGNTYRVDADVVPTYRYRDYSSFKKIKNDYSKKVDNYFGGIVICPDSGGRIINFPEQHIENGIIKNKSTEYNFKKCVRISKNIRELMDTHRVFDAKRVSSFGIESLIWNLKNSCFTEYPSVLWYVFDKVVNELYCNTSSFITYYEVNGIKRLCPDEDTVKAYSDFAKALKDFYEHEAT